MFRCKQNKHLSSKTTMLNRDKLVEQTLEMRLLIANRMASPEPNRAIVRCSREAYGIVLNSSRINLKGLTICKNNGLIGTIGRYGHHSPSA
ncbi:hypothetical protein TNIN_58541 [Trichonephila inaurata madagascariensis]|uniref:Uncharacterized protein n=1 Tax=Trichonephila inaurata madagascariensis TaxID=2747483 RepID=A0A8X6XG94_9ARAC|nr:hypothetical protein TNIN_58541 [Trichonephila inaurata madagascariensis]